MSGKSRTGSDVKRGEIAVPDEVFNLLLLAASAKLPDREHAATARGIAKRLGSLVRRQYASGVRLRGTHGWTPEQAAQPYLVASGGGLFVVPKSARFLKGEALEKVAVPLGLVNLDDETQRDEAEDWVPIGNTGPGKLAWRTPAWTDVTLAAAEAEWLEAGLDAASKPQPGRGGETLPAMLRPSAATTIHLGYAYDVLTWAKSPDAQPQPRLRGAYDEHGSLRDPEPTGTLADELAADRERWEAAAAEEAPKPEAPHAPAPAPSR